MRDLDNITQAESRKDRLRPFSAVELDYPDGIVRLSFYHLILLLMVIHLQAQGSWELSVW